MRITGKKTKPISSKKEMKLLRGSYGTDQISKSLESKGKVVIKSDHIMTK